MQEAPKPSVVGDRDVILKFAGSTVCGSDLHLLHSSVVKMEKGDILGHELCGEVESMGLGVKGLQKGDVWRKNSRNVGYSLFTDGFAGGQEEYVRVPYRDVNLLKFPPNVTDEKGLFLSDGIKRAITAIWPKKG
ncbi:hypothetical protein NHQ30_002541 [Ciborinia camelliae]|nr:hypothetical protein NHQ30_002541 [Ciborinia camelliae]